MDIFEGSASIADSNGNILFYSDGWSVWDRNHSTMPNANFASGTGLMGHPSSTQAAIVIQKPNSDSIYFIFTTDYNLSPSGLRYSEVDISLQGGLGDVNSNKNVLLTTPTCEKVTAIADQNGVDYWIVTRIRNSNTYHSYLVNSSGVNFTPTISSAGSITNWDSSIGYLKASTNGTKIASANFKQNVDLLDFDKSTGVLSNPITLNNMAPNYVYGVEFSPNNDLLYISEQKVGGNDSIFQFDLTLTTQTLILNSKISVGRTSGGGGALQLGPDGKIYHAIWTKDSLGVINSPNNLGFACNYVSNGIYLGGKRSWGGLPNIHTFIKSKDTITQDTINGEKNIIRLTMPNVFSPNNDGINDIFKPIDFEGILSSDLIIYNRWGQVVFETKDINKGWNGYSKNKKCSDGVYFWVLQYTDINKKHETLKGSVSLF